MRKTSKRLLLASAVALLAGAGQASEITISMPGDIRSIDFGVNRDGNTDNVLHHVVEALVAYKSDLSVGPMLAESWEVSEDGRAYTFTIREGAIFHNGEPVLAEDVKWSWERLLDEDTGFLCRSWFKGGSLGIDIAAIDVVDDRHVRFTLTEPNGLFLTRMAHKVCLSGIIHPDSVGADGTLESLIATGPFTMGEHRQGQFVELERFDGYVPLDMPRDGYSGSREAFVDSVRFLVTPDSAAAKTALLAGDIDILPRLDLSSIEEVEGTDDLVVQTVATAEWEVLMMQNTDPVLSDPRIRQAVAMAIDLDALTMGVTNGMGAPNPSAVPHASSFFSPVFAKGLGYDPEAAKALLAEAGYDGQPLKLVTNATYPFDSMSAVAIQSMLQAAGIVAELEVLDWASQYASYKEGDFQMMVMGFSARTDPTLMMDVVVGSKADRGNAIVDSPEIIEIAKASGVASQTEERTALFEQAHALMIEDASVVGLFNPARAVGLSPRVEGYELWSLESPRLWGVKVSAE